MKKLTVVTLLTFIATGLFSITGRDIMDMVEEKESPETAHALVELQIKEADGSIKNRMIEMWSMDKNDLSNQIMVFRTPKSVQNTRFLIKENETGDDKWIFLPALGKARRIAASDGGSSFMGTEFTYDDMSTREIDDYTYEYLGDEEVDAYDCYIVEATPVNPEDNQYSKTKAWIIKDKDILTPIKMELYNKKGELNKILTVNDLEKIEGYWIPNSTTMTNLLNDRASTIINKKIELDKKTNPALFGKRFLTTGKVK